MLYACAHCIRLVPHEAGTEGCTASAALEAEPTFWPDAILGLLLAYDFIKNSALPTWRREPQGPAVHQQKEPTACQCGNFTPLSLRDLAAASASRQGGAVPWCCIAVWLVAAAMPARVNHQTSTQHSMQGAYPLAWYLPEYARPLGVYSTPSTPLVQAVTNVLRRSAGRAFLGNSLQTAAAAVAKQQQQQQQARVGLDDLMLHESAARATVLD